MGEDNFSNLIVSNSATQEAFPKNIVKQKASAPVTNPILTTQQIAKLKHDKSLDAFHARIADIKRNVENINSQLTTGKKIQKPATVITSIKDAAAVVEQINESQAVEAVKPLVPETVTAPKADEVLIKNLLIYSELLAFVAKHPGAQVFDERDKAKGYLWVRQAGGIFNANPKLVKWLAEHKFLLKAEKGWFLPVL
jgi:phage antirepressor YoqD-like protein